MFVDTHCHIHEPDYPLDVGEVIDRATYAGVTKLVCVGTSEDSSHRAVEFVSTRDNSFASVGVHPHDTKEGYDAIAELVTAPKVVAVGEIGLDYYYTHSPRQTQIKALEAQIQLALDANLPIIFHVRDAFPDFWPILDNFTGIRGELHSFTDTQANLDEALRRGLFIGVNGISTFTKDSTQQAMFDAIPLNRLLLETDAPFLTPTPFRGKINEPAFVRNIAEYHAERRGLSVDEVAKATTANAERLFAL